MAHKYSIVSRKDYIPRYFRGKAQAFVQGVTEVGAFVDEYEDFFPTMEVTMV